MPSPASVVCNASSESTNDIGDDDVSFGDEHPGDIDAPLARPGTRTAAPGAIGDIIDQWTDTVDAGDRDAADGSGEDEAEHPRPRNG
jgi:hypothetical protein